MKYIVNHLSGNRYMAHNCMCHWELYVSLGTAENWVEHVKNEWL